MIEGTQAEAASLAARLASPFPVLADEDGSTWERYLGGRGQAAILVLDRYNALQCSQVAERVADLMGGADALFWVQFGEMACPECSVSEWE